MALLLNSIVVVDAACCLPKGRYRILDYFLSEEQFCIFKLDQGPTRTKPLLINQSDLSELERSGKMYVGKEELPPEIFMDDKSLPVNNLQFRNDSYSLIEGLIGNKNFLREYAFSPRTSIVRDHAKLLNVQPLKVYKALAKYWTYGQVLNALLMFTSRCGGRGKEKASSHEMRGRPLVSGKFIVRLKQKVNINELDKENIRREIVARLTPEKKFTYASSYDFFKKNYYTDEIETAHAQNRPVQMPTLNQFIYWAKKLVPEEEMIRRRVSESIFQKDYEGYEGSVSENITAPGMRYEIDSTTADVYMVCEFNRELILGKPTLYFLIDTASRMIVGIHISMEFASWRAARQAIFNACTSKVDYCKRYGIEIKEEDWPCVGSPARILCDRAEMLGKKPEQLVIQIGTSLEFAPPYRGDFKSLIERRFGIVNEVVHLLPGTTRAELRKRGEKDCRLDAAMSIKAFTQTVIHLCIEHNMDRSFKNILTRELVKSDLKPSPLNYWKLYTAKHQHAVKNISQNNLIARLMDEGLARVSENGIIFRGLRYSCEKSFAENWSTKALNRGSWKLECRSDESWTTDIYIKEEHSGEYLKCRLIGADELYFFLHQADVVYLKEWRRSKTEDAAYDRSKINRLRELEDIVTSEVLKTKEASGSLSNQAKIVNIKQNRRNHLESQKPTSRQNTPSPSPKMPFKSKIQDALLDVLQRATSEDN